MDNNIRTILYLFCEAWWKPMVDLGLGYMLDTKKCDTLYGFKVNVQSIPRIGESITMDDWLPFTPPAEMPENDVAALRVLFKGTYVVADIKYHYDFADGILQIQDDDADVLLVKAHDHLKWFYPNVETLVQKEAHPIEQLGLLLRTENLLKQVGIETIDQLAQFTTVKLLTIRGFGRRALNDVRDNLARINLTLK